MRGTGDRVVVSRLFVQHLRRAPRGSRRRKDEHTRVPHSKTHEELTELALRFGRRSSRNLTWDIKHLLAGFSGGFSAGLQLLLQWSAPRWSSVAPQGRGPTRKYADRSKDSGGDGRDEHRADGDHTHEWASGVPIDLCSAIHSSRQSGVD